MTEHDQDGRLQRAIGDWFERELPVHAPPMLLEGVFARTARRRWPWSRLLDHLVRHGPPVAEFAVGLLVVVAFALAVTRTDVTTSSASPAPSDARTLAVGERIEACGRMPMGLSEAHGSLWVTCAEGARRVDAVTGSVGPMLTGVASVSSGSSDTWAAVQGGIARLDPSTGGLGPTVAIGPVSALAVADHVVWVLRADTGRLVRVDALAARVIGEVDAGTRIADVVVVGRDVWTLSQGAAEVRQFDGRTGAERARVPVPESATRLATGDGALWVVDPRAGAVLRIDPASAELTTLTLLPADPPGLTDLVARPDALYVAERYDLVRRDPVTGKEQARQRLASYPRDLVGLGDDIWVLGEDGGLDRVITTGR